MESLFDKNRPAAASAQPYFEAAHVPYGYREKSDQIRNDVRASKLDLRAGMYRDEHGQVAMMECVRLAREEILKETRGREYLPLVGLEKFNRAFKKLLLGDALLEKLDAQSLSLQSIGGAGALRIGGEFLGRIYPGRKLFISAQSWGDHSRIFSRCGLKVEDYPYLDQSTGGLDFEGMLKRLALAEKGSILLLQACCHNPTGLDLQGSQWKELCELVKERNLLPFFDLAYLGTGAGIEADLWPIRHFAESACDMLVASSCCKSFSMYDYRVGALSVLCSSPEVKERILSQLKSDVQAAYSSPPREGAAIIANILESAELSAMWRQELNHIRERVCGVRAALVEALANAGSLERFAPISQQRGFFAWTGLSRSQVGRLAEDCAIYLPSNGRLCLSVLPENRIEYLARSLAAVAKI